MKSILLKELLYFESIIFLKGCFTPKTERSFYLNFIVRARGDRNKKKKEKIERRVKKEKSSRMDCYSFCERKPRVTALVVTGLC